MKTVLRTFAILAAWTSVSNATMIYSNPVAATEPYATTFVVDVLLSHPTATQTQAIFQVHNTTAPSVGGQITGIALALPGDLLDVVSLPIGFAELNSPVSAPPFGSLPYGFGTGKNWTGGKPGDGIMVSDTGIFTFLLAGSLTDSNFNELYTASTVNFVVRYQALENGGSNKVPGMVVVPEPASALMIFLGGVMLFGFRRYIVV